jgi:hypothetical protein
LRTALRSSNTRMKSQIWDDSYNTHWMTSSSPYLIA